MPETGSQILSYTGNAGLGVGANGDIPAINPNNNLNVINDAAKNIMLLNHDNNIKLYDQKIKDRDATLQLLQQGEVASGDISQSDRPYYEAAKKDVKDAFYKMVANGGVNNPEAVKNYQDKVAQLYNTAVQAQGRQIELKKLQQERANQTLPEDIDAYNNHIKTQLQKPFWGSIDPFQKAFNYNLPEQTANVLGQPVTQSSLGTINGLSIPTATNKKTTKGQSGLITNAKGEVSAPQINPDGTISPITYTPEKYWDYPTIEKNAQEQYLADPTARQSQIDWLNDVENYPDPQKLKLLDAYNKRIADYSVQRGIQSDGVNPDNSPHYPNQINYAQDPTGKIVIQETPSSFMAKHALASVTGDYVQKPQAVFNKDIGTYDIQKGRAAVDSFYKHAMVNNANRRTQGYLDNIKQQMKMRDTEAQQDDFLNQVYTRNLLQQPTLIKSGAKGTYGLAPIKAENSLPVFTLDGNKPVRLQPIGAKAHMSDDVPPKFQYWEGGHYDVQYTVNGQPLSEQQLSNAYFKFKKQAGSNWKGGINDYLKEAVKNGLMNFVLKGANGSTDAQLSSAAQRIISNTSTKKGQAGVFSDSNPPTDEQILQYQDNEQ